MQRVFVIIVMAATVAAFADIYRSGPPRDVKFPDIQIRLSENDRHGYEIAEGPAFFSTHFATLHFPEYHLNYAEHKMLAVSVAKTVAEFFGSTNDIRIVHWEQPKPASTNIADRVNSWLKGRMVTDEVIPLRPGD